MMKTNRLFILLAGLILVWSCKDGFIDDITAVSPGADLTAPQISVAYPTEGTKIKVNENITSINIDFQASDDIELGTVTIKVDDEVIASFNEFKDYRVLKTQYLYESLTTGVHVLSITAVDLEGKSTTKLVNFEKEPAYIPKYEGEVFYMPFDGSFIELVSVTNATVVGTPGFSTNSIAGTNSYAGAANSYLQFPLAGLELEDEFTVAFWYKVNTTPDRAGILSVGPPGINTRTSGFRLFREGGANPLKSNIGLGTEESWNDGGAISTTEWVFVSMVAGSGSHGIYVNGNLLRAQSAYTGALSWANTALLTIGSGAPNFIEWNHLSDNSQIDELRIFNKKLTQEEVQFVMQTSAQEPYEPMYEGEVFYMPFENDLYNDRISETAATVVGSPSFGIGKEGDAYEGAADSYLTFPIADLGLEDEFSISFWYKANITPDRAGILTVGPPGINTRTSGFRLFRESGAGVLKSNVGMGTGDQWNDGGAISATDWVFITMVVGEGAHGIYVNGALLRAETIFTGSVSWADCEFLSIGSGAPRFTEWGHLSDNSLIDEIRIFNRKLSQAEIQDMMND
ncbi:MAG: LamG domain-containing protein [Cytophagales bacterium]|nr:LamG domain-containing protein [Cytophagales bacterium]